jgi:hypothetical protein
VLEEYDPNQITDPHARQITQKVLNLLEKTFVQLDKLREENQKLRDELALLKGEQPKPTILPSANAAKNQNQKKELNPKLSSEKERKSSSTTPRSRHKRKAKHHKLVIQQQHKLTLDRATLPPDAEFKGYRKVIVRDVVFGAFNTCFRRQRFYSPSTRQTYEAPLPPGYNGQFGPGLKSLSYALYYAGGMSEAKILELFKQAGIELSSGTLSNWLGLGPGQKPTRTLFEQESQVVYQAGIASSPWQHLDTTMTRVAGSNYNCHVLTNPLYTFYCTLPQRDRLSALQALRGGAPRVFRMDKNALQVAARMGLAANWRKQMKKQLPSDRAMEEAQVDQLLSAEGLFGTLVAYKRKWIKDALAIAAYHAHDPPPTKTAPKARKTSSKKTQVQSSEPVVVKLLVCDDAPQFQLLTQEVALCWLHDVRHYKKLNPRVAQHQKKLADFLGEYWTYYRELQAYRQNPDETDASLLSEKFNELFSRKTGYDNLDERIAITNAKKSGLLMVLKHPEIELHNNPAELAARQRVRKRDVSLHARTEQGVKSWDIFQTLAETCKKLGISFYEYMRDRLSGVRRIADLGELISQKAETLELGKSWAGELLKRDWHRLEFRSWVR